MVSLLSLVRWQTVHTLPCQDYLLFVGGPRFNLEILFPPNGVDLQVGTQDCLGEGYGLLRYDICSIPLKDWVRLHGDFDQKVTGVSLKREVALLRHAEVDPGVDTLRYSYRFFSLLILST